MSRVNGQLAAIEKIVSKPQMIEDVSREDSVNDVLVLGTRNDPDRPATATADLEVKGKYAFQAVPGQLLILQ